MNKEEKNNKANKKLKLSYPCINKASQLYISFTIAGLNLDKNQYSSFGYFSLEKSFLKSSFSIDYNKQMGFVYSWSIFIDYKNLTFGYSIGSPILESISNPQIISIKFNF